MTSVQMFGAFVELGPGREGLVHISQIDIIPVNEVASVISPGDFMDVMVLERYEAPLAGWTREFLMGLRR